ncbi:hypothetical protein ACP4OV_010229 [Aristida adscensionis]
MPRLYGSWAAALVTPDGWDAAAEDDERRGSWCQWQASSILSQ